MAVRLGASPVRLWQIGPGLRDLYAVRRSTGGGVAPSGLQVTRARGARTQVVLDTTGGGMRFSAIVPYADDGTRTNFTSTSRRMLERRAGQAQWAVGYALYHISYGGFGCANPDFDANMLQLRFTRVMAPQ